MSFLGSMLGLLTRLIVLPLLVAGYMAHWVTAFLYSGWEHAGKHIDFIHYRHKQKHHTQRPDERATKTR